jgi:hypothetical protein
VAGGMTGQSTPAAADVQHAKAGSQTQPFANPIQLPQLRRGEIVALAKSAQEYCIFGSSIASKKSLLRS